MPEHVVGSGETLGSIAGRYKTNVAALAQANGIADVNLIRVGQRLRLPVGVRAASNAAAAPAPTRAPAAPTRGTPGREGSANRFVRVIEQHGDARARGDFAAGRKVVVALRVVTNHRKHVKGIFDDLIAVVQRGSDGIVSVRTFDGNTEPAGEYAWGGARAFKGSKVDIDRDGRMDTGRLVPGSYRFVREPGVYAKRPFFRADRTQVAERDTNQDGNFDARDKNRIDTKRAGRSMLVHVGGENSTGSAGCQTIRKSQYSLFLSTIGTQRGFSYVLVNK